jgi:hypothetical protein
LTSRVVAFVWLFDRKDPAVGSFGNDADLARAVLAAIAEAHLPQSRLGTTNLMNSSQMAMAYCPCNSIALNDPCIERIRVTFR